VLETEANKTKTTWRVAPQGTGATPYTNYQWSTRIQVRLSYSWKP